MRDALTAALICLTGCAYAQQLSPTEFEARGVTFYASFDEGTTADYARGNPAPISLINIQFVEGKTGQAVLTQRSKETELGKVQGRASSLNYDATGHLYGERGTLAYWFQPRYDADDPTIRSSSNSTGPYLVNVSAVEDTYYNQFIRANIKGGAFYFWVVDRDGGQHGLSYGEGIRTWKAGQWHHLVMTWDATQGMRFYDNGELKYSTWGEDAYSPATPYKIGVGGTAPVSRPGWTSSADAVYDELVLLDRAVSDDEVVALMEGRLLDLQRAEAVEYSERQVADRRRGLKIEEDPNRVTLESDGGVAAATIDCLQPTEIEMRFIEAAHLADGRWEPSVCFAQGGLVMQRDVTVHLAGAANHLAVVGRPAEEAQFRLPGRDVALETTDAGVARTRLADLDEVVLRVPGGSEVGEMLLYAIAPGTPAADGMTAWRLAERGTPEALASPLQPPEDLKAEQEDYPEIVAHITAQADPLLRKLDPGDRQLLLPGQGEAPELAVGPTRHLYLAGEPLSEDAAARVLRVRLPLRPGPDSQILRVTVPHPYEPTAFYATVDLAVRWDAAEARGLDLAIRSPGMIFPRGSRPLVEVVSSEALELAGTPELSAELAPASEQAEAFALRYNRLINQEFTSRMGVNFRFYLRGIELDSPLTRGVFRALHFDPDNETALNMAHWARFRPWPEWTAEPGGPDDFPAIARYAREAALAARDTIHWWIDERQDETGYMVGRANMWNDDTKLFNEYSFLWLLSGDEKLAAAMEKYLAAHWASGRMLNGWSEPWTDIVHSAEEASYLEPTMALVRYGDPLHLEQLMETASNIDTWTGITGPNHRHFRSNFFTAERMKTEGHFGHDVGLNATAMTASMYLAWYCNHPTASTHLTEWVTAWVEDSMAETEGKAAGLIPDWVDFASHEIGPARGVYTAELTMMMNAAYQHTGDEALLRPLVGYLERRSDRWPQVLNMAAADLRRALGPGEHDELLLAKAQERMQLIAEDSFFQRGLYYDELPGILGWLITGDERYLEATCFHAWRNNRRAEPIYTEIDAHKDRVYPWARYVLPWMYCGGNALNGRGSAPWPTIAVSWDAGYDFAALVRERSDDRLRVTAWNFGDAREVGMRIWDLPAGTWRLTVTPAGGAAEAREVYLERGMTVPIQMPAEAAVEIEMELLEAGDWSPRRPDLALSATEGARLRDGRLTVTVHNVGALDAPACTAMVRHGDEVLAEAAVPALAAPLDFEPKTADVAFALPEGATGEVTITIDAADAVPEITELNNSLSAAIE